QRGPERGLPAFRNGVDEKALAIRLHGSFELAVMSHDVCADRAAVTGQLQARVEGPEGRLVELQRRIIELDALYPYCRGLRRHWGLALSRFAAVRAGRRRDLVEPLLRQHEMGDFYALDHLGGS